MNEVTKETEIGKEHVGKDREEKEKEVGKQEEHVSFGINGEIVSSIFGFVVGINSEIPMKFEKDRIFIHLKSPDNIQYAQIEINSSDLLYYNPRLEYGNTEKNIVIDTKRVGLECIDKIINMVKSNVIVDDWIGRIDRGTRFGAFVIDDDKIDNKYHSIVKVKVFEDKIEFHLLGNIIIWAKLIKGKEMENTIKSVEKLPAIIKKARGDVGIKKASATIEQFWFDKICSIREVKRCDGLSFKVSIDKKEGFTLIQKSGDGFYELKLKPKCLQIECSEGSDSGVEDSSMSVCINKEYILPINRLGKCGNVSIGHTPVRFEIMHNKPIIIEKKLTSGIGAMLTIAPRLKTEEKDEKEIKDIQEKKMLTLMDLKGLQEKMPGIMDF